MESIKIRGRGDVVEIKGLIDKHFQHSKSMIEENIYEEGYEYIFYIKKLDPLGEIAIYNSFTTIVTSIIDKIYMVDLITEEVVEKYREFSYLEQENIIYLSTKVIRTDLVYKREKEDIKKLINEYLLKNKTINIDGFLKFRLRNYCYMIKDTVANVVSEIKAKKKYDEFIVMLKYFVDLQIPKYNYLDVVILGDSYRILDEAGVEIEDESVRNIKEDFKLYKGSSQTDMLLSSLVVLAPRNFTLHVKYGSESKFIDLLRSIFNDRLRLCHGCSRCNLEKL